MHKIGNSKFFTKISLSLTHKHIQTHRAQDRTHTHIYIQSKPINLKSFSIRLSPVAFLSCIATCKSSHGSGTNCYSSKRSIAGEKPLESEATTTDHSKHPGTPHPSKPRSLPEENCRSGADVAGQGKRWENAGRKLRTSLPAGALLQPSHGERKVRNENNRREKPSCNWTRQERSEGTAERPSYADGSRRKQEGFGGKEEARPLFARFSLNNGCCCCCCLRPSVGVWRRLCYCTLARSPSRTRAHTHTHTSQCLSERGPEATQGGGPPSLLPSLSSAPGAALIAGTREGSAMPRLRKTKGRDSVRRKEVNPQGGRETTQRKDQRREGKGRR